MISLSASRIGFTTAKALTRWILPSCRRHRTETAFSHVFRLNVGHRLISPTRSMSSGDGHRRKFILDCDTGGDDAQAILMAMAQPDVQLVAVTAVFGNTTLENTSRNSLRIVKFKGRDDIPVFKGCDRSLIGTPSPDAGYFGKDGLGDITIDGVDPVDVGALQQEHAATAMVRLVNESPGEITLVATGPLTNIALALQLDPSFGKKLKDIYVMGGTSEGKGNITPCGEFNFYCDPEAALYVLNHMGRKVILATKEVCERHAFSWEWYEQFTTTGSKTSSLISRFEEKLVNNERLNRGANDYFLIWDQITMAMAINNDVIVEEKDVYVTVETQGKHTRGHTVIDWNNKWQREPNCRLIMACDRDLFGKLMYSHVNDL